MYSDTPKDKLSEADKQNISALAQLAAGLAVAAGTGGDIANTGTAVAGGKNAVENNWGVSTLGLTSTLKEFYNSDEISDKEKQKVAEGGVVTAGATAGVAGLVVVAPLLPESAIIGGSLSGAINAGAQYTMNEDGSINWTDVGIATGVGVITAGYGTGFWGTVGWNTAGGATSSYLKDENPVTGAVSGMISSGTGYLGGKLFQGTLQKYFNPVSKQYEWVPTGVWTITKPASQSSIPAIGGNAVDSLLSETVGDRLNNYIEQRKNEKK